MVAIQNIDTLGPIWKIVTFLDTVIENKEKV